MASRQQSRAIWLNEGENNTVFFHQMANMRKKKNYIAKLKVVDDIFEDKNRIAAEVMELFLDLYSQETILTSLRWYLFTWNSHK